MKNKIIAVIPALNEEATIGNVLKNVKKYVDGIIVVDDGSSDNTYNISKKYAVVLRHKKNQGYDKSLNDGFKLAKRKNAKIIITMDADGQHLASDIPKFIKSIIGKKADIAVGKRPYKSRFMEHVFGNYGKKIGISDPLCGMKAYDSEIYKKIGFFDNIGSIGTQSLFLASKKGYKLKEIPIKLRKRKDTPRFGRKIKANLKLFFAYLRLRRYLNKNKQ